MLLPHALQSGPWHTCHCKRDELVTAQGDVIITAPVAARSELLQRVLQSLKQHGPGSQERAWVKPFEQESGDGSWLRLSSSVADNHAAVPGFHAAFFEGMQGPDGQLSSMRLRLSSTAGSLNSLPAEELQGRKLIAIKVQAAPAGLAPRDPAQGLRMKLYFTAREAPAQPKQAQQQAQEQQHGSGSMLSTGPPGAEGPGAAGALEHLLAARQGGSEGGAMNAAGGFGGPVGAAGGSDMQGAQQQQHGVGDMQGSVEALRAELELERARRRVAEQCAAMIERDAVTSRVALEKQLQEAQAAAAAAAGRAASDKAGLERQVQALKEAAGRAASENAALERQLQVAQEGAAAAARVAADERATLMKQVQDVKEAAEAIASQAASEKAELERQVQAQREAAEAAGKAATQEKTALENLVRKLYSMADSAARNEASERNAMEQQLLDIQASAETAVSKLASEKQNLERQLAQARAANEAAAGAAARERRALEAQVAQLRAAAAQSSGERSDLEKQLKAALLECTRRVPKEEVESLARQLAAAQAAAEQAEAARGVAARDAWEVREARMRDAAAQEQQLLRIREALRDAANKAAARNRELEVELARARAVAQAAQQEKAALEQRLEEMRGLSGRPSSEEEAATAAPHNLKEEAQWGAPAQQVLPGPGAVVVPAEQRPEVEQEQGPGPGPGPVVCGAAGGPAVGQQPAAAGLPAPHALVGAALMETCAAGLNPMAPEVSRGRAGVQG